MHQMCHAVHKDFSQLPLRRMRLQDGSIPQGNDEDTGNTYSMYLKLRAFWYSLAFVCMDIPDFFNLGAAETMADKLLHYLHTRHSAGRPPVRFLADAWDSTARVMQTAVRGNKTLVQATEADSTYQHFWTVYVPVPSAEPRPPKQQQEQKGKGKGKDKGSKGGGHDGKLADMQRRKDQHIATLKRDLEEARARHSDKDGKRSKYHSKW